MTAISSKYVFIAVCKCIFFSIDWLSPNQEAEKTFPLQPFKDELLQVCRTFVILYTYAQHTMADLLAIPPCYSDQTAAISLTALSSLLTSSSGLLLAPSAILIGQPLMIYCNSHTSKLIYPSIQGMPSLYSNLYVDRWQSELPFKVPLFSDRMLGDQAGPRRKVSQTAEEGETATSICCALAASTIGGGQGALGFPILVPGERRAELPFCPSHHWSGRMQAHLLQGQPPTGPRTKSPLDDLTVLFYWSHD